MRFAIVTIDRYAEIFDAFVDAGWTPIKLFTSPSNDEFGDNRHMIADAERRRMNIQTTRITDRDLSDLRDQNCDILVVAGYAWKIPDPYRYLKYAVNFHPSPLPAGRGPYPLPQAILQAWNEWAVSCHKISDDFDAGDILDAESFPIAPDECHESLTLKTQIAGKRLASRVAGNFQTLWDNAKIQENPSYWPRTPIAGRGIDFDQPVQSVLRHIRAFGNTESFAKIGEAFFTVKRGVGWREAHALTPGTPIHFNHGKLVVATTDGFIGLLDVLPISASIHNG